MRTVTFVHVLADSVAMKTRSISVGIIEPQRLFAPYLTSILDDGGFNVVLTLDSISADEIGRHQPRVIFIDVDFITVEPVTAIRQVRSLVPNATICAYTGKIDSAWAATCSRAGANCVLTKAAAPEELIAGIQRAMRIGVFVDPRFDDEEREIGASDDATS